MFAKLIDMSNLGLFLVAERGKGKTTVLDTVRDCLRHRDLMQVSIISYAGIAKMADEIDGKSITMINRDFSSFYTDYLKDVAVNLIASLITDKVVKADTGKYHFHIDLEALSFLSATQPQMLEKLNHLPTWESMYRDRFIRYPILYWFGEPIYRKDPPRVSAITLIPDIDTVSIPKNITEDRAYERMMAIIERQTSEGRCQQYTDRLLKAHAAFNERDIVLPADLEFIQLFAGNLLLDYLLSDRVEGVSRPLIFNSNSYILFFYLLERGEASKVQMRQEYNVSNVTITKNLNPLMARNLIKGTYGKDKYVINKEWIDRYAGPVRSWFRERRIHE